MSWDVVAGEERGGGDARFLLQEQIYSTIFGGSDLEGVSFHMAVVADSVGEVEDAGGNLSARRISRSKSGSSSSSWMRKSAKIDMC